jgi:hypothetical protein
MLTAALAGLAACSSPEGMHYEVTQRTADTVSIQMNVGNMDQQSPMVAEMKDHMNVMAEGECLALGKSGSAYATNEWTRRAGPYYTWKERSYKCG